MDLSNINFYMFLEFPGILITAGVVCLLVSIVIIIAVSISEKKQQNIRATALSPNYGYIPEKETNYPEPNYTPNASVILPTITPNEEPKEVQPEPQIDAFESEFSNEEEPTEISMIPKIDFKDHMKEPPKEEKQEEKTGKVDNNEKETIPTPDFELPEIKIAEKEEKVAPMEDFGLPKFREPKEETEVKEVKEETEDDEIELL